MSYVNAMREEILGMAEIQNILNVLLPVQTRRFCRAEFPVSQIAHNIIVYNGSVHTTQKFVIAAAARWCFDFE